MAHNTNAGMTLPPGPGLHYALLLFLYGDGTGKRPSSVKELADKAGCHEKTIMRHLPAWREKREELFRNAPGCEFSIVLSQEARIEHERDVEFLREKVSSFKREFEQFGELEEDSQEALVNLLRSNVEDPETLERIEALYRNFLRVSHNRQKVFALFLQAQKRWQDSSGVAAALSAVETDAKERARGRAKLDTHEEWQRISGGEEKPAKPATRDPVFRKSSDEKGPA